jgi:hypothetical protein
VDVQYGCGPFGRCGRDNNGRGLLYLPTCIHQYIPLKKMSKIKHGPQKVGPQKYHVMYNELQITNYILLYC